MEDKLRTTAISYIEAGWQKGDVDALDVVLAERFVNRGSNGGGASLADFKKGITELFAGMPNFSAVVEDVIIDAVASRVAIRWIGTGTHTGVMMGMPPTGKHLTFRGIDIVRIENERVIERWGESNAAEAFS